MSENHQMFGTKDLREKLSERGYKMTPQRKEILQVFVDHSDYHHMSAEEVYNILRENVWRRFIALLIYLASLEFSFKWISATVASATNLIPPTPKLIIITI